jgi:hypothetical protein
MLSKMVIGSLAIQAGLASPLSRPLTCAPVSGNKTIDAYQLYPENVDFDTRRCVLYSRLVTTQAYCNEEQTAHCSSDIILTTG